MISLLAMAWASPQLPIPLLEGPFAPSEAVFLGDPARLAEMADCVACHPAAADTFGGSAHAHASLDNPWYLASFDALRADVGFEASRHCGGCHDPALLAAGLLDGPIAPDHELADRGVTCLSCHGVTDSSPAGNGSFQIDVRALPDPETDVAAHATRMLPESLSDGTTCQSCHRGVLLPQMGAPHIALGFDDWGAWEGSAWAGTDAARFEPDAQRATCVECHGHAMSGGRTALADGHLLDDAVRLWLPLAWVDGEPVAIDAGFAPEAGAEVVVDAVVRNTGVGHRFPGGLGDTQDVWLSLRVEDHDTSWTANGPHLRALPLDLDGRPVRDHQPQRVALGAFDHTVPPGEAQVLRVGFVASGGPIQLSATLLHRPHRPELAAAACAATTEHTLDGCAPQPITTVAVSEVTDVDGWYALALGHSRGASEDLDAALDSASRAREAGLLDATAAVLEARVLGRQGRIDEALALLEPLSDHPSVHATRGQALLAVWRWEPAAEALERAVAGAPLHVPSWRGLSLALGSAGDAQGALEAARQGLALAPRDPQLLRSLALAARALEHPQAEAAEAAWLAHRAPDGNNRLRMTCDRNDEECGERAPIPTMWVD